LDRNSDAKFLIYALRASRGAKLGSKLKQLLVKRIAIRREMRSSMAIWTERNTGPYPVTFLRAKNVMNIQETSKLTCWPLRPQAPSLRQLVE
jgi:hypothetical protein